MTALPIKSGTGWTADLLLGIRLSMGARRAGWTRLLLTAIGTGVGVLVLLFASSVPNVASRHDARSNAGLMQLQPVPGVHPLYEIEVDNEYHGDSIALKYVRATGANSPVPPGLSRLPKPGELVLSPALARLLSANDGKLLRPRLTGHVVGAIGAAGLGGPADLTAYVGAEIPKHDAASVYRFGNPDPPAHPTPPLLVVLVVVGAVVLLFPVFVFVVTASRLSGAERDRRLAAIRLVGADIRQIRRIAAGEAILGALVGLVIGGGMFLALRPLVERQSLDGYSVFARDVAPSLPLIVLIAVAVPALAVGATLFALRRTIIEPLGVIRQASPSGRRLWWRLVPVALGVVLLALQLEHRHDLSKVQLAGGVVALLLGIPVLLPWILQRVVGQARRGTPALQLATGRLRLDSGTPARVVAGVAVVLAGAVALFSLLAAAERDFGIRTNESRAGQAMIDLNGVSAGRAAALAGAVARQSGVTAAVAIRQIGYDGHGAPAYVSTCSNLSTLDKSVGSCRDGDVFADPNAGLRPGGIERVQLTGGARPASVRLPHRIRVAGPIVGEGGILNYSVVFTPGALRGISLGGATPLVAVRYDQRRPDAIDLVRNAAAPLLWRASVEDLTDVTLSADQKTYATIQHGLYAGALLTLGMAGATLLVLAVEQVRERRQPLAVLAASGVSRLMLARSVLWQNAIPLALAVLVADATGIVLGAFLLRIADEHGGIDWSDVAVLTAVSVLVVAVATALTLPAVRRATRPEMLRAE